MKKRILATSLMMLIAMFMAITRLMAQEASVHLAEAGTLWDTLEDQGVDLSTLKKLRVSGSFGEADIKFIRGYLPALEEIDLSETSFTTLPAGSFADKTSLVVCRLPETIESISERAFYNCTNLSILTFGSHDGEEGVVVFPASLRYIEGQAFYQCNKIETVDLRSCSHLDGLYSSFYYCTSLKTALLPTTTDGNTYEIGWECFSGTNIETLTIPNGVRYINGYTLPSTLRVLNIESDKAYPINEQAFYYISDNSQLTVNVPVGMKKLFGVEDGWSSVGSQMQEYGFVMNYEGDGVLLNGDDVLQNGDKLFHHEQALTLKAQPAEGYEITSASVGSQSLEIDENGNVVIPAGVVGGRLKVVFGLRSLSLNINVSGDGVVKQDGVVVDAPLSVLYGTSSRFELLPNEGALVQSILFNGEESVIQNGGLTYTTPGITENSTLTIVFGTPDTENTSNLTSVVTGEGYVQYKGVQLEQSSSVYVRNGENITLSFVPTEGMRLDYVKVDGEDKTSQVSNLSLSVDVTADTQVEVGFISVTIADIANPDGGKLYDQIQALGVNVTNIKTLKVRGNVNAADWSVIKKLMPNLQDVDLSETDIEEIPYQAFSEKKVLQTVVLPLTVTKINEQAFYNCSELTTIEGCDNVTHIGQNAFWNCPNLSMFPFGEKLIVVEYNPFEYCYSLPESLVLPATITTLGDYSFYSTSVKSVDMSQCGLFPSIYANQFGSSLEKIVLPQTGSCSISWNGLSGTNLKELHIPTSIYRIEENSLPTTLEHIYVESTTPLEISEKVFQQLDMSQCTLHVPTGTAVDYRVAAGWSDFMKVEEFGLLVNIGEKGKLFADSKRFLNENTYFLSDAPELFNVQPDAGWHVSEITWNNQPVAFADNSFTLSNEQLDGKLSISFAVNQFSLQIHTTGEGQLKWNDQVFNSDETLNVDSLSVIQFSLEPAAGNVVTDIVFNDVESVVQNGGAVFVTPAIVRNSRLDVTFSTAGAEGDKVNFEVTTGENGSVEYKNTTLLPETNIFVEKGQDAVFTIKPSLYYVVDAVKLDGVDVTEQLTADNELVVPNVDASSQINVSFRVNADLSVVMESAGTLSKMLNAEQKQKVTKLTISGPINEADYITMRDEMPLLSVLDLWDALSSYIPSGAFCQGDYWAESPQGKRTLTSVRLPKMLTTIFTGAFAGCTNLNEVNFEELNQLNSIYDNAFRNTSLRQIDLSNTIIIRLENPFSGVSTIESIKFPKTIEYLGAVLQNSRLTEVDLSACTKLTTISGTFSSCNQLKRVILPEGLTRVEGSSFYGCNSLEEINFPASLQFIGSYTFYESNLKSVDLSNCSQLRDISTGVFINNKALSEVKLPSNLEKIGSDCFRYCDNLQSIDLSKTMVQNIENSTFQYCYKLEKVELPKSLVTIGNDAFIRTALNGIFNLPGTVTSIAQNAFYGTAIVVVKTDAKQPALLGDNALGSSVVAAFVPEGSAETYRDAAGWENLIIMDKEVHADVTVENEGSLAVDIMEQAGVAPGVVTHLTVHGPLNATDFAVMRSNMTLLYDLDLSDAEVSVIPERAFLEKKILMNVKLPRELLIIQENAFGGCSSLNGTLTLPSSVTTIGQSAFLGCTSLEKVELSSALEVIRGYAFEGCSSLQQDITFPQGFTSLGEYAFANCRSLTGTVKFNSDFYMFMGNEGYWANSGHTFENCTNIEAVDMSACENVYQLPVSIFQGCTSLQTIALPPYLERIEGSAFNNNTSLTDVEFPSSLMYIDDYVFSSCTSLKRVNLSNCSSFATIGNSAFSNCSSLESVSLPASLNWIQGYAFSNCRNMSELTVEALQPADLGEHVFNRVRTERCVLSIPTGTFNDYLTAAQWGEFVSMRKSIEVKVDEGAELSYSSGNAGDDEEEVDADEGDNTNKVVRLRRARRAPVAGAQHGNAQVKDGSSLYVQKDESVTFYINPDENVSVKQVLFNGEDVTGEVVAGTYTTPGVTDASSFQVLLNIDGPITVKELRMLSQSVSVKVAESAQIKAAVYPTNATNKTILWTSSDEQVARVADDGTVTGVAAGRAVITAKTEDGDFEQTCELVVMSNDYYITLSDEVNTFVDNSFQLPMMLHNAETAQGIQFDVYLPEGLHMNSDWTGSYGVWLSNRAQGHTVTAARRNDGSVRVVVYSINGNAFTDNDGQLLALPIITGEQTGTYEVEVKNIHISGPNSFNFSAPDYKAIVRVADYPLGDSNGNGDVTISDVTNTVDEILERSVNRFVKKAADVNGDGIITVSDVTGTIDVILERPLLRTSRAASMKQSGAEQDKVFIDDFSVVNGGKQTVNLKLSNTKAYTAFQCDILLPEGLRVATTADELPMVSVIDDNAGNHTYQASYVGNGALRLIVMSMNNAPFASGDAVVSVTVEADSKQLGQQTIDIQNVRLVDAANRVESLASDTQTTVYIVDAATGIDALTSGKAFDVFSASGKKVRHQATTLKGLPKGVYIVNGQKVTVK